MTRVLLQGLLALAAIQIPSAYQSQNVSRIKVPNLEGRDHQIASQALRLLELQCQQGVFYIAARSWRDDITPGVVQMQTPRPGAMLPEGAAVALWTFEKAPENRKILQTPDVRKLSRADAEKKLRDAGLTLMRGEAAGAELAPGQMVEDQYPRPGQSVFEATSVYLTYRR